MTIYTKGTFKIVENPAIVEKFLLTEQSAIVRFYCTYKISVIKFFISVNRACRLFADFKAEPAQAEPS